MSITPYLIENQADYANWKKTEEAQISISIIQQLLSEYQIIISDIDKFSSEVVNGLFNSKTAFDTDFRDKELALFKIARFLNNCEPNDIDLNSIAQHKNANFVKGQKIKETINLENCLAFLKICVNYAISLDNKSLNLNPDDYLSILTSEERSLKAIRENELQNTRIISNEKIEDQISFLESFYFNPLKKNQMQGFIFIQINLVVKKFINTENSDNKISTVNLYNFIYEVAASANLLKELNFDRRERYEEVRHGLNAVEEYYKSLEVQENKKYGETIRKVLGEI